MADFDNLFDGAIADADEAILRTMGIPVQITSGRLAGVTITGIYDDPENIAMVAGGIRLEDSLPSLFVRTASVSLLCRQDTLDIGGESFFVDRITPDDGGSCCVHLRRHPGQSASSPGGMYERT
ncbi:phage Head-Tail Attachment [Escherichia coli M605]|uniref:Phage Head-Tail Attachment n=1 Tax=Escherichia coli M605 TaxID=656417 RepID=F4T760_ECOLX|nr:head-tail joining protein [Escherichia coli]EGI13137.1 phage Head-Tail Attachment [Escherichia coli M605]